MPNIYLGLGLRLESIWHCPFDFNFRVTNDMSFGLKGLIGFLNCTEGNKAKTTLIFYLNKQLERLVSLYTRFSLAGVIECGGFYET